MCSFIDFLVILGCGHISGVNYDEIAGCRPKQPAYEIFSIKRRFWQLIFRLPRFK